MINPTVVEGQHQGGFAQGLGNVLHEELHYSDDGQPLCSTLVDYTIPGAPESVALRVVHRETPSHVLGGFRGAGEAAITAAPAVLVAAVEDALAPLGVRLSSTRLNADALWRAIDAAEIARGAEEGRPRSKFTDVADMLAAAATAPAPPLRRRLSDRLGAIASVAKPGAAGRDHRLASA